MGLIHHLHKTNVNVCSAKLIPISRTRITRGDHLDELMNYLITTTGKHDLLVAPNVFLCIEDGATPNSNNNILAHHIIGILHYKITLYSYKLRLKQLKEIVAEWTMTYRDYIKEKNKGECSIDVF